MEFKNTFENFKALQESDELKQKLCSTGLEYMDELVKLQISEANNLRLTSSEYQFQFYFYRLLILLIKYSAYNKTRCLRAAPV